MPGRSAARRWSRRRHPRGRRSAGRVIGGAVGRVAAAGGDRLRALVGEADLAGGERVPVGRRERAGRGRVAGAGLGDRGDAVLGNGPAALQVVVEPGLLDRVELGDVLALVLAARRGRSRARRARSGSRCRNGRGCGCRSGRPRRPGRGRRSSRSRSGAAPATRGSVLVGGRDVIRGVVGGDLLRDVGRERVWSIGSPGVDQAEPRGQVGGGIGAGRRVVADRLPEP